MRMEISPLLVLLTKVRSFVPTFSGNALLVLDDDLASRNQIQLCCTPASAGIY